MMREIHESGDEFLGIDPEIGAVLSELDPARRDSNYWLRFRWWVVSGAAAELARRRRAARLTVGDVLESWARTLVPTAALVVAVACMLLFSEDESAGDFPPLVVEELVVNEVEGAVVPLDAAALTFASEIF